MVAAKGSKSRPARIPLLWMLNIVHYCHLVLETCGVKRCARGRSNQVMEPVTVTGHDLSGGYCKVGANRFAVTSLCTCPYSNPRHAHMHTALQSCETHSRPSLRCVGA